MSSTTINDVKNATTGAAFLYTSAVKPGLAYNDPAIDGLIDAPDWVPTGSHRAVCNKLTGSTIVFGETGRPGWL